MAARTRSTPPSKPTSAQRKAPVRKKAKPAGKPLVIVESPAKARTISRFLGPGYAVEASIGHVRDLPERGSDLPEDLRKASTIRFGVRVGEGYEPVYVVPAAKREQIRRLKRLLKDAPELWLATDEDREGEAISWHLVEVLSPRVPTHRLVFHEITREAIARAMAHPREIDMNLVDAQETRRVLDRLVGYELSPVLWRKIRTRLSAGRVQSVALRLLVEREKERIRFRSATWWDLTASFAPEQPGAIEFPAVLVEVDGRRVATPKDFDAATGKPRSDAILVLDEAGARALVARLRGERPSVVSVEQKPFREKPKPPFTTSTLQQAASRRLRLSARRTMSVAQGLYENGLITYMRTDSVALSDEALGGARKAIRERYGDAYLGDAPRRYKTKVKNAQEAHEAIRPAGASFASVASVRAQHGREAGALYELIWQRTVASQMPDARGHSVTIQIALGDARFRAGGRTIEFPGFRAAYAQARTEDRAAANGQDTSEAERVLPSLAEGQTLETRRLEERRRTTAPPRRYSDAMLVKELDERGIGRPSTWASTMGVLLDRGYA
ncbi:MAG: type I DNA topoisomerase, partial [Planctomycetota bacterium]